MSSWSHRSRRRSSFTRAVYENQSTRLGVSALLFALLSALAKVADTQNAANSTSMPDQLLAPFENSVNVPGELNDNVTSTDRPPFEDCILNLALSDMNRDREIGRDDEYLEFINRMADNAYGDVGVFWDLPEPLVTNFQLWASLDGQMPIDGAFPGDTALPEEQKRLDIICYDVITILHELALTPSAPSMAPTKMPLRPTLKPHLQAVQRSSFYDCRTNMAVADLSRDRQLDTTEYVRFLNLMSDNQYGYAKYQDLPALLRFNFVTLSQDNEGDGQRTIDVSGSSPGDDVDDLGDEQLGFLERVCSQTETAINNSHDVHDLVPEDGLAHSSNSSAGTFTPTAPDFKIPTDEPVPSGLMGAEFSPVSARPESYQPAITYDECRVAIAISDSSRDNMLNQEEYVELVSRLSGTEKYRWEAFDNLPSNVKETFNQLAAQGNTVGEINVYGASPGQFPTTKEKAFLEQVCTDTQVAIDQAPTQAPDLAPTNGPIEDISVCLKDLALSDTSPRNNFLGTSEYVVFINRQSSGIFFRYSFLTLPKSLRENFETLASVEHDNPENNGNGEAIYVYGSNPLQTPDAIQVEFLRRVCMETQRAITIAETRPEATAPPVLLEPLATEAPAIFPSATTATPTSKMIDSVSADIVGATDQPTVPWFFETNLPVEGPMSAAPTLGPTPKAVPTTLPKLPEEASDEGNNGANTGAIIGGTVGGFLGLILFGTLSFLLYKKCAFEIGGRVTPKNAQNNANFGEPTDGDDDQFQGFGAPPGTPTPGKDAFENIGVPDSPPSQSDDPIGNSGFSGSRISGGDLNGDLELGSTSESRYGEYGGPHLPGAAIDFGANDDFSSSSGSKEEGDEEEESYETEEEKDADHQSDSFGDDEFFPGDKGNAWGQKADDGGFFSGTQAGWGRGQKGDEEEAQSTSGSYSDELQDSLPGKGQDEEETDNFERGGSSADVEDDASEQNDAFGGFDAFGDGDFGEAGNGFVFAEEDSESYDSGSVRGEDEEQSELRDVSSKIDEQIDNEDWDGVVESIQSFDYDRDDDDEASESSEERDVQELSDSYRARVENLVSRNLPDEIGNIDDMLEQFAGREEDLIQSLLSMEEQNALSQASSDTDSLDNVENEEQKSQYSDYSPGESDVDEGYDNEDDDSQYSGSEYSQEMTDYSQEEESRELEGSLDEGEGSYYDEEVSYTGSEDASYSGGAGGSDAEGDVEYYENDGSYSGSDSGSGSYDGEQY